jgi:hypothetical protein
MMSLNDRECEHVFGGGVQHQLFSAAGNVTQVDLVPGATLPSPQQCQTGTRAMSDWDTHAVVNPPWN